MPFDQSDEPQNHDAEKPQISEDPYATSPQANAPVPENREQKLDTYATDPGQSDEFATLGEPIQSLGTSQSPQKPRLRFRKIRFHAEGGLGRVSLAQDNELKRQVAIKEIKEAFADYSESQARFVFEAEVTGRLEHPGIVPVYALGRHVDGRPYYAMRFITGDSMEDAIKDMHLPDKKDEFDRLQRDLLNRLIDVCNTMHYAHNQGFIHRDLKPANIMLGDYGETLVVDWGLAKNLGESAPLDEQEMDEKLAEVPDKTSDGSIVGTAYYMPPEQAAGAVDLMCPQSDVYSLGACLYQLLTGQPPMRSGEKQRRSDVLKAVRAGDIQAPNSVSARVHRSLNAICMKSMAPRIEDRYESAKSLAGDLENFLADEPVSALPENFATQANRWMRKHKGITNAVGISLFVILLIASSAFVITRSALNNTQRLLTIAQLEQQFDSLLSGENERILRANLAENAVMAPETVDEAESLLDEIEGLKADGAVFNPDENRRLSFLDSWERGLRRVLEMRMDRRKHQLLVSETSRLKDRFPWPDDAFKTRVEQLEKDVETRIAKWFPLETNDPSSLGFADRGDWLEQTEDTIDQVIQIANAEPGNQQISIRFTGAWKESPGIGITLNDSEAGAYSFVIASEDFAPNYGLYGVTPLGEAIANNRVAMFIYRRNSDGAANVLRLTPVDASEIDRESVRLVASRQNGSQLMFRAEDIEISFEDPIPQDTSVTGSYGIICSQGTGYVKESLLVEAQNAEARNAYISEIETGDIFFARGQIDQALDSYQRVKDSREAMFKQAICYLQNGNITPAIKLLDDIVFEYSIEGELDPRERQYYLFAGVRRIIMLLDSPNGFARTTVIVSRLRDNFALEDVQQLIPEDDRMVFRDVLLKPGKRSRMVFDNREEITFFETFGDIFSNNKQWRRLVQWRLADAYQAQWDVDPSAARAQARVILDKLLAEVTAERNLGQDVDTELVTLIRDIVWLDLLDEKPAAGLSLVAEFIQGSRNIPSKLRPLLIERARCLFKQENLDAARQDLELFLKDIDPQSPPEGIHGTHFAEACAILGIIFERQNQPEQAEFYWKKGRRRHWLDGKFPPAIVQAKLRGWEMILESEYPEPYLQGRTDGYTDTEMKNFLESLFGGSGMDDMAVRNMLLKSETIPLSWTKTAAEQSFVCPRGKKIGEQAVLHQLSMRDGNVQAIAMALYGAVMYLCFDGDETLEKYPEADPLVFRLCMQIIGSFQTGNLDLDDIRVILSGFGGAWSAKSFDELVEHLDDRTLSSGFALVLARMLVKKTGKKSTARKIIAQYVEPFVDEIPQVVGDITNDTLLEWNGTAG